MQPAFAAAKAADSSVRVVEKRNLLARARARETEQVIETMMLPLAHLAAVELMMMMLVPATRALRLMHGRDQEQPYYWQTAADRWAVLHLAAETCGLDQRRVGSRLSVDSHQGGAGLDGLAADAAVWAFLLVTRPTSAAAWAPPIACGPCWSSQSAALAIDSSC